eukprot:gene8332-biopygen6120
MLLQVLSCRPHQVRARSTSVPVSSTEEADRVRREKEAKEKKEKEKAEREKKEKEAQQKREEALRKANEQQKLVKKSAMKDQGETALPASGPRSFL